MNRSHGLALAFLLSTLPPVLAPLPAAAQGIRATGVLEGFGCMSLKDLPTGVGPDPAPVPVFASPEPGAALLGDATLTVLVPVPLRVEQGRVWMLRANGQRGWIDQSQLTTWRSPRNPAAQCVPAQLSNGRYGTMTR